MNCARVREELKAYIDGELRPWTRWLVSRHIATCDDCRREMQEMAELTSDVRTAAEVAAPQGLREKVLGSLTFQPARRVPTGRPFLTSLEKAVAGVAVVLVLGAVILPIFSRARESARVPQGDVKHAAQALRGMRDDYDNRMPSESLAKAKQPAPVACSPASGPVEGPLFQSQVSDSIPQLIIKTAELGVKVGSFDRASDEAVSIAKSAGGYVTDTSSSSEQGTPTEGCLTLRIPAVAFERTLSRLAKLGSVTSRSITGEDVTGENGRSRIAAAQPAR